MKRAKPRSGRQEVVRVVTPEFLVSSAQQACRYETADGGLLAPGHYLAVWPSGASDSSYGREVRYLGPFETPAAARLLEVSALSLGIAEPPAAVGISAKPYSGRSQPRPNCGAYFGIACAYPFAQC